MREIAKQSEPELTQILKLNAAGQGVAEHAGTDVILDGALPGETVSFRRFGGRRGRRRTELVEVLKPSAVRVEPPCPHFGVCGACKLQHLEHREQLAFKQAQLLENLESLGGLEPVNVLEPLTGPLWHYRRKARLSVRWVEKKGRVLVGFREINGRYVADVDKCLILDERIASILPDLSELIGTLSSFKRIPQLEVACGDEQAALIFRILDPIDAEDEQKLRLFAQGSGIGVFVQPAGPASITALEPEHIQLDYNIPEHDVRLEFGPANFVQVNAGLNQLMVNRVLQLLDVSSSDTVLDLFCGLGNFTLPLARYSGHVFGVEGDADLVALAHHNAKLNNLDNVDFEMADLAADDVNLPEVTGGFSKILLDPPRSGAAAVLPAVAESAAERVVYVSCNPVTLAQDAGKLVQQHGFQLESAGIMDMFPHTAHIESCALFTR